MDANEKCPWCGSVISHEKFVQIENKIREQERRSLEDAKSTLRKQLEGKFTQDLEAARKAAAQGAQEEANKRIAQAAAERDRTRQEFTLLQAREAEARKQAQEAKASADAIKKTVEQQLETARQAAQQRGKEEAQKEFAALEAEHKKFRDQFRLLQASEAEARKQAQQTADSKATLEKSFSQRLEAEKLAAEKRAKQETEALLKKEMGDQRAILEREHDADLANQKADFEKQNEGVSKELQEANRKLEQQKTAHQLGDGAEVDLYEDLRREFSGDRISRVPKGQPGPDIRHYVVYKGEVCGQIVYDSKKQQQWRWEWISKLHQDQVDASAQHAILATTVFPDPKNKKELCIESGVIVINPKRAVYISHILRDAMITMHVRGLGERERVGKTNRLYEYINSNEHKQKFDQVVSLNKTMQELDAEELEAHTKVWGARGKLLKRQQHALHEIDTEVAAIVEAPAVNRTPAA